MRIHSTALLYSYTSLTCTQCTVPVEYKEPTVAEAGPTTHLAAVLAGNPLLALRMALGHVGGHLELAPDVLAAHCAHQKVT